MVRVLRQSVRVLAPFQWAVAPSRVQAIARRDDIMGVDQWYVDG